MSTDGKILYWLGIDTTKLQADVQKAMREFLSLGNVAKREGDRMDSAFRNAAKGVALFFTAQQGMQLASAIIRVRGEFQKYEAVLKNTLGSQKAAQDAMALISDIAAKTPFGVDQLTSSYIKLVNQGFKPTRDMIISLGDLASSQGKSFDQLTEAIIDAQTGEFERLKEFGIRASKEGDRVTFTFKEQAKTVDFTASSIRDYILSLGQMQGVAGGMAAISETIEGKISNLQDSITAMFNEIGQGTEGAISKAISTASFLVEHYEEIGKALAALVVTYGVYKTAVIAAVAVQRAQIIAAEAQAFLSLARSIKSAKDAQLLLNMAMNSSPILLAASIIAGVATALVLFSDKTDAATEAQERLNAAIQKHQDDVTATKVKLSDLINAIKDENTSNDVRSQKLSEIHRLTNGRLGQLTVEAIRTGEATAAINEYIAALDREARAKAQQDIKIENYRRLNQIDAEIAKANKPYVDYLGKGFLGKMFTNPNKLMASTARTADLMEEKKAREAQNKAIDDSIREQAQQDAKRANAGQQTITRNYEYWQKQKESAEASYKALDEIGRKSKQGQLLVKQILEAEKQMSSYNVTGNTKSADKAVAAVENKAATDASRLAEAQQRAREELERKKDDLRIQKLEGVEKEIAINKREFDAIREEYEQAKIYTEANKKLIDEAELDFETFIRNQAASTKAKEEAQRFREWMESAVEAYGSYEQKKEKIRKHFDEEMAKAAANPELQRGIQKARADANRQLDEEQAQNLIKTEKFFDDILLVSTTAVQAQITNLNALLENSVLGSAERAKIEDELKRVQALLSKSEDDRVIAQSEQRLKQIDKTLQLLKQHGLENTQVYKELFRERFGTEADKADASISKVLSSLQQLADLAPAVKELGDSLQELGGDGVLGDIGAAISGIGNGLGGLVDAFKKVEAGGITSMDAISAAANFAIQAISSAIASAAARKRADEEWYLSRLEFQYKMNQAVLEEMKMRQAMDKGWFTTNNKRDMENALALNRAAYEEYQKAFDELNKGQAKLGQRNKIDWGKAATTTISGAAAGAVIGSAIAGVGTGILIGAAAGSVVPVIGTIVGAVVGLAIGIFANKKKKDVWGDLLKEYPELVTTAKDGSKELNEELAKQLSATGLINKETQLIIDNIRELKEKYKETLEEIKNIVIDVAGNLGDNMRNSLVQAFKDGTDAAQAFGDSVGKVVEDLVAQMLFNEIFEDQLGDLKDRMIASFDILSGTYDANWVDDILDFYKNASGSAELFFQTLDEANRQMKEQGLNIFDKKAKETQDEQEEQRKASEKGIASMSQDTANELNGRFTVIQGHTYTMNENIKAMMPYSRETAANALEIKNYMQAVRDNSASMLIHLSGIEKNTGRLESIERDMRLVKDGINDINLKGITIKTT